jgi:hypothetical protein
LISNRTLIVPFAHFLFCIISHFFSPLFNDNIYEYILYIYIW